MRWGTACEIDGGLHTGWRHTNDNASSVDCESEGLCENGKLLAQLSRIYDGILASRVNQISWNEMTVVVVELPKQAQL